MEENNIIICENCYEENEKNSKTCKNCGAQLYKNNEEKGKFLCKDCWKEISKEEYNKNDGACKECYIERKNIIAQTKKQESIKEKQYEDSSNSSNVVAEKFILVVLIIKILGYLGAIIIGAIYIGNIGFGPGLLIGGIIAISVWFSTLIFEAIAEGLNLLQDIKNKM